MDPKQAEVYVIHSFSSKAQALRFANILAKVPNVGGRKAFSVSLCKEGTYYNLRYTVPKHCITWEHIPFLLMGWVRGILSAERAAKKANKRAKPARLTANGTIEGDVGIDTLVRMGVVQVEESNLT